MGGPDLLDQALDVMARDVVERQHAGEDLDRRFELLGDRSDEAAKVYAIRRASALTTVAEKAWAQAESVRNCSQIGGKK